MANPIDPKHIDKRTTERYLRNGELDEKTYQRHIESLTWPRSPSPSRR